MVTFDSNQLGAAHDQVASLVSSALRHNHISGLSEVLSFIARSVGACGSILWQVAPVSELNSSPPAGRLFVQADWFDSKPPRRIYELPLSSPTGNAIFQQKVIEIRDIGDNTEFYGGHSFLQDAKFRSVCSIPITDGDAPWGALDLFKSEPSAFSETDINIVSTLTALVPALYRTIRDEVSYDLILRVNELLHKSGREGNRTDSYDDAIRVLNEICKIVGDTFQCMETSLFLENPHQQARVYELVATTWPWTEFPRRFYKKHDRKSLTSWVLSHPKQPVKIFDLAKFDRDNESILRDHPGIRWSDSLKIRDAALKYFQIKDAREMQPLSFMAAPLTLSGKVLGVIRCCTAKKGPYYFADHEAALLNLVGTQISQYWNNWLRQNEIQQENESWKNLVTSVGQLNSFVRSELKKESVDEGNIFLEALKVTSKVIAGADILDVRMRSPDGKSLVFAKTWGKHWHNGQQSEILQRFSRRFPLDGDSAGAFVIRSGEVYEFADVKSADHYDATFGKLTKRMIVAPIRLETGNSSETYGVLDIRGTESRPFPAHARAIAELLGQQLGLYHFLVDSMGKLHRAEMELKRSVKKQTQTFEDLEHQLRSPINQAYARMQLVLRQELLDDELESDLLTIRGLCGKARRVTKSIGLYSELASGRALRIRPGRLTTDDIQKAVIEAALDARLLINPKRLISFYVQKESFDILQRIEVYVDHDLLDQAISNVIDNAYKYSYRRTQIRIYGGLTDTGQFYVSVGSVGLPIHAEEITKLPLRGWRSGSARLATGEGSGIGLWIVEHIMVSHGGALNITPTSDSGVTEVKLVFPIHKAKRV